MMKKFVPRALCAAALLVAMVGGPVGAQAQVDAHPVATVSKQPTITIHSLIYSVPRHVRPGTTVKVVNQDDVGHTVTGNHREFRAIARAGATVYFVAPATPGKYGFYCEDHASMHGELVVKKRR